MLLLDKEKAQEIDKRAVERLGIPLLLLMENAGQGVCQSIIRAMQEQGILNEQKEVIQKPTFTYGALFIVGVGNNGGDGLVAARHLQEYNIPVKVYIYGDTRKESELFKKNLTLLQSFPVPIERLSTSLRFFREDIEASFCVVDGLLGTGIHGHMDESMQSITKHVNEGAHFKIAIDVPSGLQVDTGAVSHNTIKADRTVTMGAPKVGMYLYPGKQYVGQIDVVPLGGPGVSLVPDLVKTILFRKREACKMFPKREENAHKGTNGHVLIVGGAPGMWGAPLMAAQGAAYSGSGKITLAVRKDIYDSVLLKADSEIMGFSIDGSDEEPIADSTIQRMIHGKDALVIGPGLGRTILTKRLLERVLQLYEGPMIIDADGLFYFSEYIEYHKDRDIPLIITPHVGEFAHMTHMTAGKIESDRPGIARAFAQRNNVVLVLKGAPTVIATPSGDVIINDSGNKGMGTGGMGDVLSGIIGSYLGQGLSPEESAMLSVYIHGASADLLEETHYMGYTALDVAKCLGKAQKHILSY